MRSLLVLAAFAAGLTVPTTGAPAYAVATCQGLPATIEASSGAVTGTPGPDVIVATTAVTSIDSGEGDDTICVALTTVHVEISTGSGDDVVDTTAARGDIEAYLGIGSDTYRGGAQRDVVATRGRSGTDSITTGGGPDDVVEDGRVVLDAGNGDDHVLAGVNPGDAFDLGAGIDTFETGGQAVRVDLVRGRIVQNGDRGSLLGVEDVEAIAPEVVVIGDDAPNRIQAGSCHAHVTGGAGDDLIVEISMSVHVPGRCVHHHAQFDGGPGGDVLRGSRGDDVLVGGPGRDAAYGGRGTDRCVAERRFTCER